MNNYHGYQSLREKVISLSLEIEDRAKVLEVLRGKIADERSLLRQADGQISESAQHEMDVSAASFKQEHSRLVQLADAAVEEKKTLLQACKDSVEAIRSIDEEAEVEAKRISSELKIAIETERKLFKAGSEDRLQKFVSSKIAEFKAQTQRALAPEMTRLAQKNTAALAEIDLRFNSDERKLRIEYEERLSSAVAIELERFKSEQIMHSREKSQGLNKEIEDMERLHRKRLQSYSEEYERELDKLKDTLAKKAAQHRRLRQQEASEAADSSKRRLTELRNRHESELNALRSQHEVAIRATRDKFADRRNEIEVTSKLAGATLEEDLTESQQKELIEFRKTAEVERDRRIQSEIRQVQSDCIRREREAKKLLDSERERIHENRNREERELARRQRNLTDLIAELSIEKEQLIAETNELVESSGEHDEEMDRLKKDIDVYQTGIAAQRLRYKDADTLNRMKLEEMECSVESRISQLKEQHSDLIQRTDELRERAAKELDQMRSDHDNELDALDMMVKQNIGRKEEELSLLRDAVETEKIKMSKLEKMVKRYTSAAS